MRKLMVVAFLFFAVFLLFGCAEKPVEELTYGEPLQDVVSSHCVNACLLVKDKGTDLSNGPCLGLVATDWVCDVVHEPRISVDNLEENQCADFREGKAHHFVEVDQNCKVIVVN